MPQTDRRRVTRPADTSRAPVSDVRQLSLPVQLAAGLVLTAITATLSASAAIWANQRSNDAAFSALDTKVQLILKEMDGERRVGELNTKLYEQTSKAMAEAVASISKRQELQQLQISEMKESIVILTSQGRK